jgi:hypothetical protein
MQVRAEEMLRTSVAQHVGPLCKRLAEPTTIPKCLKRSASLHGLASLLEAAHHLRDETIQASNTMLKAPKFEPEGDVLDCASLLALTWPCFSASCRATIDAEKAVFHRIVSCARKAVFGPGALSMGEAEAFVEALQQYKVDRAVALTTQTKE